MATSSSSSSDPTGGGILRSRPRYSSITSQDAIVKGSKWNYEYAQINNPGHPSSLGSCNGTGRSSVAVTALERKSETAEPTPKMRTLADLVSSSASLSSEARDIIMANERGNVVTSHKAFISQSRVGGDSNPLSLKSALLISDDGTPYIKEVSESGPDNVDANSVIALGVMGEDGQRVRFCEYKDISENGEVGATSSRDRLGERINSKFDEDDANTNEEDDTSDSDRSSTSLGSAPDEEILHELGLSELILDDDDDYDSESRITMDSKKLRSFRILWELLSRWATPSTVELVLHYQGKGSPPPSPNYECPSSNPSSKQYTEDSSADCARNVINIGASRIASIISMLKMNIPRSLNELRSVQYGKEKNAIDQRMAEQRLADLVRTFDPSAPAADLNMKLWKGLTTILIVIAFPSELLTSSTMDARDDLLPLSIRRLNMASAEYRYLTRSVFSSLSGMVAD